MWKNPFRREVRASYTDVLTDLLIREASGSGAPTGMAHATAVAEACAGKWAHAFAAADLEPDVLDPFTMASIGRDIIVRGESIWLVAVGREGITLLPVGDHDVLGQSPDPATWSYRVSTYGPSGVTTQTVPAAAVVHIRYSVDPSRPWRGISPLERAGLDAELLSALLSRLKEESGAPVAHVIPSPVDGQANATATLRTDLKSAKGGVVLAETMAGGYGDKGGAPAQDWTTKRIGANPPAVLPAMAGEVGMRIAEAMAVPGALLTATADGTSQREGLRRWVHVHVAPVGRIVAQELANKLDAPGLSMDFRALYGSDIVGRSSAFKRMVDAGLAPAEAAELAGLS